MNKRIVMSALAVLAALYLAGLLAYASGLLLISLDTSSIAVSVRPDEWHKFTPLVRWVW